MGNERGSTEHWPGRVRWSSTASSVEHDTGLDGIGGECHPGIGGQDGYRDTWTEQLGLAAGPRRTEGCK